MESMPGHPRLYRRGATYYHRAAIPIDIKDSYPKTEETFSLGTKDHAEAVKLVRIKAAEVDQRFDAHRENLKRDAHPLLKELPDAQIKRIGEIYYGFLLEEDEETREEGFFEEDDPLPPSPIPTFEEYKTNTEELDQSNRYEIARGKPNEFYQSEAREVLTWSNVNLRLDPASRSWRRLARELQASSRHCHINPRRKASGRLVLTGYDAIAAVHELNAADRNRFIVDLDMRCRWVLKWL